MSFIKKIISAILIVFMLPANLVGFVSAQNSNMQATYTFQDLLNSGDKNVEKLHCLGVLSEYDMGLDINGELTRAEFVEMVVNLMGYGEAEDTELPYRDVPADYWASGYISTGYRYGMIAENDSFSPTAGITYNECTKILVEAMGYGYIAREQGGYPEGYIEIASMIGLNKKTAAWGNGVVYRKNVLKLLDNTLESNILSKSNQGYSVSDETFMEERLKIEVLKGKVEEIFFKERRVRVSLNGVSNVYELSDKIDINGIIEDEADIYILDDPSASVVIQYIKFKGTMQVYYDFLYEVNGQANGNEYYGYGTVKKIFLRNEDEEFDVANDAIIYCDDIDAREQAVPLNNAFAKIVVSENKVVKIEAYNLKSGGIIYRADSDKIKYIRGDINDNVIEGFEDVDDLRIYIDGKQHASMYDLKDSMFFDFWVDNESEKFIIVASSRVHEKKLESFGTNELVLDGQIYEINPQYGLYVYSNTRERYMLNSDLSAYMGNVAKVFVDDNKYIRYIKIDENVENTSSFLGVITKAYYEEGLDDTSLEIYKITGGREKKVYKVRNELSSSSISIEYARSVAKNLEGKGFFKFTLSNSNEIVKIEEPDLWGSRTTVSSTISETNNYYLNKLYVRYATIFAIMEHEGEFTVKFLEWDNHLRNKSFDEPLVVISDYDPIYNPVANYVMITGGASTIHYSALVSRFVTDVKTVWDESKAKTMIQFETVDRYGTYQYKISADQAERWNLKKGVKVEGYSDYIVGEAFRISKVIDTSVSPDLWANDNDTFSLNATTGFYRADKILYRDGDVAQFMVNGVPTDVMPLNEYYACYEVVRNRGTSEFTINKKTNPLGYIDEDDNVWFEIYSWGPEPRSVGYVIYEKVGMAP